MSIQAISKPAGWDRKTVRRYLQQPSAPCSTGCGMRKPAAIPFDPYLEKRMRAECGMRVSWREMRERNDRGGYTILKDWLPP